MKFITTENLDTYRRELFNYFKGKELIVFEGSFKLPTSYTNENNAGSYTDTIQNEGLILEIETEYESDSAEGNQDDYVSRLPLNYISKNLLFTINIKNNYSLSFSSTDKRYIYACYRKTTFDVCSNTTYYDLIIKIDTQCHLPMLKAGQYLVQGSKTTDGKLEWKIINPPKVYKCTQAIYNSITNKIPDVYYCI